MGAFFVSAFLCCCSFAQPLCPAPQALPLVQVAYVIDGDTLRLRDGRRVRMSGINAPELAAKGRKGEAFAVQAKGRLQNLVDANRGRLHLQLVEPGRDRYGRLLAHLYGAEGDNLEARLLREGLAFTAAFTPASEQLACLWQSEALARRENLGVWRRSPVQEASELRRSGFAVLSARIQSVQSNATGLWLSLSEYLVLQVPTEQMDADLRARLLAATGQKIEVRGWVVDRGSQRVQGRARWVVKLSHPSMLVWL